MRNKEIRIGLTVLWVLTAFLANVSAGEWQNLFDGKSLSGWKYFTDKTDAKVEDTWSVKDGIIVCSGEPIGFIYTEKKYQDFEVSVEYRWAPGAKPGNSGVFLRVNGELKVLPRGIEHQLKAGSAGDLFGFQGMKLEGDAARFRLTPNHKLGGDLRALTKMAAGEKAPGEWNRVEIRLQGGNLQARVNGTLVNEAGGVEVIAGHVGLQSEGGEVHFRNVRLRTLD